MKKLRFRFEWNNRIAYIEEVTDTDACVSFQRQFGFWPDDNMITLVEDN